MGRSYHASFRLTAVALLLAAAMAPRAAASGFQLRDQSGSGQGDAYAGITAGGSDISSMFFNPAAMGRFEGNRLQVGGTFIDPTSKFSGGSASFGLGGAIPGANSTSNVASSALIPTVYAMWSVSPDLKLGVSVNVPFGLTTNYAAGWDGRYQAVYSHLETLDIAPAIAWRPDPMWSLGFAFVARRAKAELSQALDLGSAAAGTFAGIGATNTVFAPGSDDGQVDVQGSSWAYGYKLGVIFEPSKTLHLGLGYQSAIRETIKGTATFTIPGNFATNLGTVAAANSENPFIGAAIGNLVAAGANGPVSAVLHLPSTLSLGAIWDLSPTFSLAAEVAQTRWSTFHELRITFSNPAAQPDNYTEENWKDTMFWSVGGVCHPEGPWSYRAGLALDKSPVPDADRTPRIPDADRTWVSLGFGYEFNKSIGLDVGYSHLFCKDSTVNLQAGANPSDPAFLRGNLSGDYKNSIDILSAQLRFLF